MVDIWKLELSTIDIPWFKSQSKADQGNANIYYGHFTMLIGVLTPNKGKYIYLPDAPQL